MIQFDRVKIENLNIISEDKKTKIEELKTNTKSIYLDIK